MIKCPVCKRLLVEEKWTLDNTLMESWAECSCGWSYDFATGAYRESFGTWKVVTWSHNESVKDFDKRQRILGRWYLIWRWVGWALKGVTYVSKVLGSRVRNQCH